MFLFRLNEWPDFAARGLKKQEEKPMRILQKISLLLLGCLAMTVFTDNVFAEVGDDSDLNTVVEGNSAFALDLYAKLGKKQGNLFFSPYSISTALGMVYGGARGNTEKQMAEVLHFTLAQKQFHPAFARLEARLNADQKSEDIDLNIANALWIQKDYSILKNFLDLLKTNYQAGPRPVDFIRAPEDARKKINAWVEEATKAKIKDLIKAGVLGPMIRLVLVNAIYFKGNWSSRFEKRLTQAAPFRMESGKTVSVPMMTKTFRFAYGESDNLQLLELAYGKGDFSMIVLLPKRDEGLDELEKKMSVKNLKIWLNTLKEREVAVFLPRFKLTSEFGLGKTLAAMGMPNAFRSADFSGIDGTKKLEISAILHKAFIDVNEEGTEAAAATSVMVGITSVRPSPPVFRADHPFVFLIRENRSGSILFLGRIVNPKT